MITHLLNRDLTVNRATLVPDGAGGWTEQWSQVGEVRCMVSQPSTEERQTAQQMGVTLSHVVHALPDADVQRGDELGGDLPSEISADHRLRVVSVISDSRSTYRRLGVEAVQAGSETT